LFCSNPGELELRNQIGLEIPISKGISREMTPGVCKQEQRKIIATVKISTPEITIGKISGEYMGITKKDNHMIVPTISPELYCSTLC
jgi:hypothetical protein